MLFPFAPIRDGICEEPYRSDAYNQAEKEYEQAGINLTIENLNLDDIVVSKSNFSCSKAHLACCVSILKDLHSRGLIESVEALPKNEDEIKLFSRRQLEELSDTLGELYFNY